MYKFGKQSREKLETLDPKLQDVLNEVIKHLNISIISGHRGEFEQNVLYKEGRSKLKYPKSKHNTYPSRAVDIMLWNNSKPHIRWNDINQMQFIAGYTMAVAAGMGIKLRSGADWNQNHINDEAFYDGAHFELKDE